MAVNHSSQGSRSSPRQLEPSTGNCTLLRHFCILFRSHVVPGTVAGSRLVASPVPSPVPSGVSVRSPHPSSSGLILMWAAQTELRQPRDSILARPSPAAAPATSGQSMRQHTKAASVWHVHGEVANLGAGSTSPIHVRISPLLPCLGPRACCIHNLHGVIQMPLYARSHNGCICESYCGTYSHHRLTATLTSWCCNSNVGWCRLCMTRAMDLHKTSPHLACIH